MEGPGRCEGMDGGEEEGTVDAKGVMMGGRCKGEDEGMAGVERRMEVRQV